jgi:hypothetical protein
MRVPKTVGYLYNAELWAGLDELGFGFGSVRKVTGEIAGIPKTVLEQRPDRGRCVTRDNALLTISDLRVGNW